MRAEGQELKPSPEVSHIRARACLYGFLIFKPGQGSYLRLEANTSSIVNSEQ